MDRETLLNKITEIGACEDDAKRSNLITEILDEVPKLYDSADKNSQTIETLNKEIEKSKEDMDELRKANKELFRRLGVQKTPEEQKKASTGISDPEEHKRKFEDLFNEKGMIK